MRLQRGYIKVVLHGQSLPNPADTFARYQMFKSIFMPQNRVFTCNLPTLLDLPVGGVTFDMGGVTFDTGGVTLDIGGVTLDTGEVTFDTGGVTFETGDLTFSTGFVSAPGTVKGFAVTLEAEVSNNVGLGLEASPPNNSSSLFTEGADISLADSVDFSVLTETFDF